MSCSFLLNCRENVLDHLRLDVVYVDWLTSSNPSHIIQIISSSHNYSGTLKKKKSKFSVQWLDCVLGIRVHPGSQGPLIGCNVDSTSADVFGFLAALNWVGAFPPSSFFLCTPLLARLLSLSFWCPIQGLPTVVARALFFLLRGLKNLSCLKRSNFISLFVMITNTALREERRSRGPSGGGVGYRSQGDKEWGSWLLSVWILPSVFKTWLGY